MQRRNPAKYDGDRRKFHFLFIIEAEIATSQIIELVFGKLTNEFFTYDKKFLADLKISDLMPGVSLFFIRCASPLMGNWVDRLAASRIDFYYLIDDNFWELEGSSQLAKYYKSQPVRSTLAKIVTHSSSIVTNSTHLQNYIEDLGGRVETVPAFFDYANLPEKKPGSTRTKGEIRVGFAASPGREKDLLQLKDALQGLLDRNAKVVLEFVGAEPKFFKWSERIRYFEPLNDYKAFIEFMQGRDWDIGLAPLSDSRSNDYKTNNKYREYGALGIPSVYSASVPYQESVENGVTGYVASSPEEWDAALSALAGSEDTRTAMSKAAHLDVAKRFSLDAVLPLWRELLLDNRMKIGVGAAARLRRGRIKFQLMNLFAKLSEVKMQVKIVFSADGLIGLFQAIARVLLRKFRAAKRRLLYVGNRFRSFYAVAFCRLVKFWPIQRAREVIDTTKRGVFGLLSQKSKARKEETK